MRRTLSILLLFLASALAEAQTELPSGDAQPALSEEQVSQICLGLFTDLMSPYCPGATLRDCGSGQASNLRDRVRDWVREGRDQEWIENQLVSEFGEMILGAPRFQGFSSIVYIAPVLGLLLGLSAILAFVRRQKKTSPIRSTDAALELLGDDTPGDEYRQRVRAELEIQRRS